MQGAAGAGVSDVDGPRAPERVPVGPGPVLSTLQLGERGALQGAAVFERDADQAVSGDLRFEAPEPLPLRGGQRGHGPVQHPGAVSLDEEVMVGTGSGPPANGRVRGEAHDAEPLVDHEEVAVWELLDPAPGSLGGVLDPGADLPLIGGLTEGPAPLDGPVRKKQVSRCLVP